MVEVSSETIPRAHCSSGDQVVKPDATTFRGQASQPLFPRLAEVEGGRFNNLNLIRLCLASAVVYSHCFVLQDDFANEPMQRWFAFYDLGGLAVMCFFFISGYLIFKSALRSSPEQFVSSRVLRLFPALAVVSLVCAFVLGPLVTTLPFKEYISSEKTWIYVLTMVLQLGDMRLPGVFGGGTVNQPLWTLSSEWLMYAMILVVCFGRAWGAKRLTRTGTIAFGIALAFTATLLPAIPWGQAGRWIAFAAAGATAYLLRRYIPLSIALALLLVAGDVALLLTVKVVGKIVFAPAIAYALLVIGFHPRLHFRPQHMFGDYSYGVYILGWPCQQLVKPFVSTSGGMFLCVFPLALILAVLSWHFVEGPSLRRRLGRHRPLEPILDNPARQPLNPCR